MGRKKLSEIEKAQALTKIKMNVLVTKVAADLNVSRQTVYTLLKATQGLPEGIIPKREIGSGRKRKTTARTDHLLTLSLRHVNLKIVPTELNFSDFQR